MSKVRVDLRKAVEDLNQFSNAGIKLAATELEKKVISEIEAGRSPVKQAPRRFPRYSESYRNAIKGKAGYFTKNGKTIAIETVSNKDLRSMRASSGARKQNRRNKEFIKKLNKNLEGKKVSPVNLKVSGKLLKSIFSRPVGSNKVSIGFDNFLADIHNRQGAGGNPKAVRRMLPTNEGETFSDNIFRAVLARLDRFAKKVFR